MTFKLIQGKFRFLSLILESSAKLGAYKVEITPGERQARVIAYTERGSREFMRLSPSNYALLLSEVEDYLERGINEIRIGEAVFRFSLSLFPLRWGDQVLINFHK